MNGKLRAKIKEDVQIILGGALVSARLGKGRLTPSVLFEYLDSEMYVATLVEDLIDSELLIISRPVSCGRARA